jgi:hypothetical protein
MGFFHMGFFLPFCTTWLISFKIKQLEVQFFQIICIKRVNHKNKSISIQISFSFLIKKIKPRVTDGEKKDIDFQVLFREGCHSVGFGKNYYLYMKAFHIELFLKYPGILCGEKCL